MIKNPYAFFLESVEKPARYIGGEHFMQRKTWDEVALKMCLCFPDTYEVGMSHLGMKILYEEINTEKDLLLERCFTPWVDMEAKMREYDLPLVSLENFRPLCDFDLVGFSLQFEMSYTNILTMLDLGRIPVLSKDREDNHPIIAAGGPCATHPEPLAPFIDCFFIGDGEKHLKDILHFIDEKKRGGVTRKDILKLLSEHFDGVYVPSLYETYIDPESGFEIVKGSVKKHIEYDLVNFHFPTKSPIPHLTAVFDRFSVELSRGCTEGCRFCQAGIIYRPLRERHPKDVIKTVVEGLKSGGFDEASLTCLSTADYSAVTPLILNLLDDVSKANAHLGLSSLRAYGLDPRVFDKLSELKATTLTFAPEAASERMRKVINKNITEEDMLKTAENIFLRGWQKIKLYFMIGLPTETDPDVEEIIYLAVRVKHLAKQLKVKAPSITAAVSTFVPRPHTPFQWAGMETLSEVERKLQRLFILSRQCKIELKKHMSKISYLEALVARGDRRIGKVILDAWKDGARFDGWHDTFKYDVWEKALNANNISIDFYLRPLDKKMALPWDHIDVGVRKDFLAREWDKAMKEENSVPCLKAKGMNVHHSNLKDLENDYDVEKKKLVCYSCGLDCSLDKTIEQRREFLKSLNALEQEEYVRPESSMNILEKRQKVQDEQAVRALYRISFSKIGPLSFISHLDMLKIMERIFRRASIPLVFTQGYTPKPLLSFGPALTLGICSLEEYMDVHVSWPNQEASERGAETLLKTLQEHSERGIIFNSIQGIDKKAISIQDSIKSIRYFYPVEQDLGVGCDLQKQIDDILSSSEIIIHTFSKKDQTTKDKDIRPFIADIKIERQFNLESPLLEMVDEVSLCKKRFGLMVTIAVIQASGVRPNDFAQVLRERQIPVERPIKISSSF